MMNVDEVVKGSERKMKSLTSIITVVLAIGAQNKASERTKNEIVLVFGFSFSNS